MFIACPTVPTEVLNDLSAHSGNLDIANFQAIEIARTECDKSFFCECHRCTRGRSTFLQAIQPRPPPVTAPPRFKKQLIQPIPENHAITIADKDLSPSSRIAYPPPLSLTDSSSTKRTKAPPPLPPSTLPSSSNEETEVVEDSSCNASHISEESEWLGAFNDSVDDEWCHASIGTQDGDPLILDRDTQLFDLQSTATEDSYSSRYQG